MRMVAGRTYPTAAKFGFRMSRMVGLHTATATGCGSLITAGLGSATSLGAGHLITMDAGCGTEVHGDGGRVRFGVRASIAHSGRRLMYRSLDLEVVSVLESGLAGVVSAGCRSDPVTGSIPGGADTADASVG